MKYATSKIMFREIDFEVENNIVTSCEFVGGAWAIPRVSHASLSDAALMMLSRLLKASIAAIAAHHVLISWPRR